MVEEPTPLWVLVLEHFPGAVHPAVKWARKPGPSEACVRKARGPAQCQPVGGQGTSPPPSSWKREALASVPRSFRVRVRGQLIQVTPPPESP